MRKKGWLVETSLLIFGNWKSKKPNGKAANSSEMGRSRKNIFWWKHFLVEVFLSSFPAKIDVLTWNIYLHKRFLNMIYKTITVSRLKNCLMLSYPEWKTEVLHWHELESMILLYNKTFQYFMWMMKKTIFNSVKFSSFLRFGTSWCLHQGTWLTQLSTRFHHWVFAATPTCNWSLESSKNWKLQRKMTLIILHP